MTILLTVLKVLGWIVLVLFLLLIVIIGLLLFVPVTYRADGFYEEEIHLKVRVSWLLRLISLHVRFEKEQLSVDLRLFGFRKRLFRQDAQEAEETLESDLEEAAEDSRFLSQLEEAAEKEQIKEPPDKKTVGAEPEDVVEPEDFVKPEDVVEPEDFDEPEDWEKAEEPRENIMDRIRGMIERIRGINDRIWGMIDTIRAAVSKVLELIRDEQNQAAARHLKKELFYLLKRLLPSRCKISARFSAGAPDRTGQALGVIAMFPYAYRNQWVLTPDFTADAAYVKGEAHLSGHLFLFCPAGILIRILKDRNCRRLYRKLRQSAENI